MLPRARHEFLLRKLELHESIRASDIAEELGVSHVTVRRDIAKLDADGLLARVHGGALPVRTASRKPTAAHTLLGVLVPSATVHFPEIVRGMESVAAGLTTSLSSGTGALPWGSMTGHPPLGGYVPDMARPSGGCGWNPHP